MKDSERDKLYFITLFLDFGLIYLCTKKKLPFIDKYWCYTVLFIHSVFYYALYQDNRSLLDRLHLLVALFPLLSIFTKTIYPKLLSLFLVLLIQYLWVVEGKCILNEDGQESGCGGTVSIGVVTLTSVLSFQIGKLI